MNVCVRFFFGGEFMKHCMDLKYRANEFMSLSCPTNKIKSNSLARHWRHLKSAFHNQPPLPTFPHTAIPMNVPVLPLFQHSTSTLKDLHPCTNHFQKCSFPKRRGSSFLPTRCHSTITSSMRPSLWLPRQKYLLFFFVPTVVYGVVLITLT